MEIGSIVKVKMHKFKDRVGTVVLIRNFYNKGYGVKFNFKHELLHNLDNTLGERSGYWFQENELDVVSFKAKTIKTFNLVSI